MSLKIITKDQIQKDSLTVDISGVHTDYTIDKTTVEIKQNIEHGFNLLSIKSQNPIEIIDVKIDENSIRNYIYLSFIDEKGKKIQPGTYISNTDQSWILPLIYPYSNWITFILKHIPNGYYGSDLFKDFHFFFPERIKIKNTFSKVLCDYFYHDSEYTIIDKKQVGNWYDGSALPYQPLQFEYDRIAICDEIKQNINDLKFDVDHPGQNKLNLEEFGNYEQWATCSLIEGNESNKNISIYEKSQSFKHLENLYEFINRLPITNLHHFMIATLPPNSFIYPHSDSGNRAYQPTGTTTMYFNLEKVDGVFFKFGNVGLVPNEGGLLINNKKYAHAVVNQGDKTRYILTITGVTFDKEKLNTIVGK